MADGDGAPDWRETAGKDGYGFMPKSDLDSMKTDANAMKDFRAKLPDKYRNDPGQFFTDAEKAFTDVVKFQTEGKTDLEKATLEITALKGQVTKLTNTNAELDTAVGGLKKDNHNLNMWGLVTKTQQLQNVLVDDTFISEAAVEQFDMARFDTSTPEGQQSVLEAISKEILTPAIDRQSAVISRVTGGTPKANGGDPGQGGGKSDDDPPPTRRWGGVF